MFWKEMEKKRRFPPQGRLSLRRTFRLSTSSQHLEPFPRRHLEPHLEGNAASFDGLEFPNSGHRLA